MPFGTFVKLQWDRALAVALTLLGGVLVVTGWMSISATPYAAEQLPYIMSSGVGGLFLLGVGATLWLSADLRDEWRKLDSVDDALRSLAQDPEEGLGGLVDLDRTIGSDDKGGKKNGNRSLAAVSGSSRADGR